MRAYRKQTMHPFCLYLTAGELASFLMELDDALSSACKGDYPTLEGVEARLTAVTKKESTS